MVSILRPIEAKLEFDDRAYKLGEAINVTLELVPRGGVEAREARVDLVCEVRYVETHTIMMRTREQVIMAARYGGSGSMPPRIAKRVVEEHAETTVHSSMVLVKKVGLPAGVPRRCSARLKIPLERPDRARRGELLWTLVTEDRRGPRQGCKDASERQGDPRLVSARPRCGPAVQLMRAHTDSRRKSRVSEENKDIVRRSHEEIWNNGKLDAIDELISPDLNRHHHQSRGRDKFKQRGGSGAHSRLPNCRWPDRGNLGAK